MDPFTHTLIAAGSLFGAYFAGRILYKRDLCRENGDLDQMIAGILDKLERDGFLAVEKDKEGDKELVPISEIVAKALREAYQKK